MSLCVHGSCILQSELCTAPVACVLHHALHALLLDTFFMTIVHLHSEQHSKFHCQAKPLTCHTMTTKQLDCLRFVAMTVNSMKDLCWCRYLHKMVKEGLLEPTESRDAYKVTALLGLDSLPISHKCSVFLVPPAS